MPIVQILLWTRQRLANSTGWVILLTWSFSDSSMVDVSSKHLRDAKICTLYAYSNMSSTGFYPRPLCLWSSLPFLSRPLTRWPDHCIVQESRYFLTLGHFPFHTKWMTSALLAAVPIRKVFIPCHLSGSLLNVPVMQPLSSFGSYPHTKPTDL